jgi:Ca2+-binding RTX toxin-like protein
MKSIVCSRSNLRLYARQLSSRSVSLCPLCGGGGNNTIRGLEGNDILRGQGGADTARGGLGDDTVIGDGGADSLFGGEGPTQSIPRTE